MEKFTTEVSAQTPSINFDLNKGLLEISGPSIPENSIEFYQPLFDAIERYSNSAQPQTTVNMRLEYFNTSSSKCILLVFQKLEKIHRNGNSVTINWYCEQDDQDMIEACQDYEATINIPFKIVPVSLN